MNSKLKNSKISLILCSIALAALILMASYAYFASNVDLSNKLDANVQTAATSYVFTVKGNENIQMDITALDMTIENNNTTSAIKSNNANLVVNLQSPSSQELTICTYDIVWEWSEGSDVYTTKDNSTIEKEFTVILNKNLNDVVFEKDLSTFTKNENKVVLYHGSTKSTKLNGIEDRYKVEAKIYNIPYNQPNIRGKKFKANIKIDNINCKIEKLTPVVNSAVDASGNNVTLTVNTLNEREAQAIKPTSVEGLTSEEIASATVLDIEASSHTGAVTTTIDVSDFASPGDVILLYHKNGNTWENLGQYIVSNDGTISASIESFSPFMIYSKKYGVDAVLPSEYQQVEYIESTGTQYIDTNYKTTPITDTIEIDFKFNSMQRRMIAGLNAKNDSEYEWWYSYYVPEIDINHFALDMKYQGISGTVYLQQGVDALRHTLKRDKLNVYWDGVYKGKITASTDSVVSTNTFLLFKSREGYNPLARIFFAKISNNNAVIRDLIPCYRKSDNVIGMYDLTNNVFYTNAGSGSFTKGPNVVTT